ncbi:hypothetical protein GWD52_12520 [Enterobacteriaceae bacterium 4M9]|nr:hypothetical protein [Enterobacteriaceae bacterium 4M9]
MKKKAGLLFTALALTGCKTELMTEINLSDLLAHESKVVSSMLKITVASCKKADDVSEGQFSLSDTQQKVALFIPGAEFVSCSQQKAQSVAVFTAPVVLNAVADKQAFSILQAEDMGMKLMVGSSPTLREQFAEEKRSADLSRADINVTIKINNNIGKDFKIKPVAAWADDLPVVTTLSAPATLKKGKSVTLRLSDVSVSSVLQKNLGFAPVLLKP